MTERDQFVYDLIGELRRNPERRELVSQAMTRLDRVTADYQNGKASRQDVTAAEAELVPRSGFNFGLLVPRCFHSYPEDRPLDLAARPFMFAMTTLAPGSIVTFKSGRQVGKCAVGDTEVQTSIGAMSMRDLFEMGAPA